MSSGPDNKDPVPQIKNENEAGEVVAVPSSTIETTVAAEVDQDSADVTDLKTRKAPLDDEPHAKKFKNGQSNVPPVHEMVGGSSIRQYLNKNLTQHLLDGLRMVSQNKPEDPLKELGEFLILRSKQLKEEQT